MDEPAEHDSLPIHVAWPDSEDLQVRVSAGACRLRIHTGDVGALLLGSYVDPTGTLPITVTEEHGTVKVSQQTRLSDVRSFRAAAPVLDLALGVGRPVSLHLATGASEVALDLGGLWLSRLSIRMGAGSAEVAFDTPTSGDVDRLDIEAGAASVTVRGLGHASPDQITVVGGAAAYDLSFDGTPRRDIDAKVTTAGANVVIRIPEQTPARVGVVSVLAGLTVRDGFATWEDSYWTQPGVDGQHPLVSIDTSITLGGLELVALPRVEPPGIEPGSH